MDPRERKQMLGQWGVRDPSPRELAEGRALSHDLEGSPVRGRPLRLRARNFRPAVDSYIASLGGPLPYMIRLRMIAEQTEAHERALAGAWRGLACHCEGEASAFARTWRLRAARWDFGEVNDLIDRHNRWYPAESRLPMDIRRRDFVLVNGEPYTKRRLDAAWVLERFPSRLGDALAAESARR